MARISFIIPAYNVESYLAECVDSILNQGEQDIQLILVNDGSTDGTGNLCCRLAAEHSCIRVIHKENGGASTARNTGLDYAEGEYIAFVDGDDRIAPGSLSLLLRWTREEEADICFLNALRFYPDNRRVPFGEGILREKIRGKDRETVCHHLSTRPKFSGSACTKLFRREFLNNERLRFMVQKRHAEDLTFCRDCILRANHFDLLDMPYYEYRQRREGSVTATFSEKGFYDMLQFVSETAELLTVDQKEMDAVAGYVMSAAAYEYSLLIWQYSNLPREARKNALKSMKRYAWVMKFAGHRLVKMVGLLSRTMGIRVTSWMLVCYKRFVRA